MAKYRTIRQQEKPTLFVFTENTRKYQIRKNTTKRNAIKVTAAKNKFLKCHLIALGMNFQTVQENSRPKSY